MQSRDSRYTLTDLPMLTPPPPCIADGEEPPTPYARIHNTEVLSKECPVSCRQSITQVIDELGRPRRIRPSDR